MIHNLLKDKKVVLASASPRRKELFRMVGIKAVQMPTNIDEKFFTNSPIKLVKTHSVTKAQLIAKKVDYDCLVVAADTIVYCDKQILGKPRDKFQAAEFLSRLSGNSHFVYTGVAISYKNRIWKDFARTAVEFYELSAAEIEQYIQTGESFDKAGAYGIQGFGSQFIKKINGCYFNVMGFPVPLFYEMLKKIFSS